MYNNLIVAIFIMCLLMFCTSTGIGVYIMMLIKLLRNDIERPGYQNKEMKDVDSNDNKDVVKDFLRKTAVEKSKANYEFTIASSEEKEFAKVDSQYDDEDISYIHERIIENEKSIKEALEEIEPISFSNDDIEHEFTIERELETLPFIEEDEITQDPIIEDTEIIFQQPIKKLNKHEFENLDIEEKKQYITSLVSENYSVEEVPNALKDVMLNLDKFCSNKNEFIEKNESVNVLKDSDTGHFKFNFEPGIEGIYMNSQGNGGQQHLL
jgi:hypothetical protein